MDSNTNESGIVADTEVPPVSLSQPSRSDAPVATGITPGPWVMEQEDRWPFRVRINAPSGCVIDQQMYCISSKQQTLADCLAGVGFTDVDGQWSAARAQRVNAEQLANARAIAALPELIASLTALLKDINEGLLVRDITRDGEPGWSMRMLSFQRLQAAQQALAKATGGAA